MSNISTTQIIEDIRILLIASRQQLQQSVNSTKYIQDSVSLKLSLERNLLLDGEENE